MDIILPQLFYSLYDNNRKSRKIPHYQLNYHHCKIPLLHLQIQVCSSQLSNIWTLHQFDLDSSSYGIHIHVYSIKNEGKSND